VSAACALDGQAVSPAVIYNPPGLSAISYRVGEYTSFIETLMQNLPGEVALQGWHPTADGDLAVQLLEWWAYIADILTFYNERIANNSYIGTAVVPAATQPATGSAGLPDNPTLIAQVTGYRSTPGVAAAGQLAVLVNSKTAISLPPLFAVQSKPGPGQQPQVFEALPSTNTYLPTTNGGAVPVELLCSTYFSSTGIVTGGNLLQSQGGPLLQGTITSIKTGDMVVIAATSPSPSNASSFAATVKAVTTENDPTGQTNTRLALAIGPAALPSSFTATSPDVVDCQVLRSIQSAPTYAFDQNGAVAPLVPGSGGTIGVHLASLVRDIQVGDLVVLGIVSQTPPPLPSFTYVTAAVAGYQETIWYANADPGTPQDPPTASTSGSGSGGSGSSGSTPEIVAIAIPHSFITLEGTVLLDHVDQSTQTVAQVWYGFRSVSVLLDEMPSSIVANAISSYKVQPAGVVNTEAPSGMTVLLEGVDGIGATATLTAVPTATKVQLTSSDTTTLNLPLRLLFNVINVNAGKTVTNEVLGNGDATVASQSFTLQKSPLTYLKGNGPNAPTSTLTIQVDNVAWTEVANFNGQSPTAKIFITQQDKSQNTTVTFGDGLNGARLTSGNGNVTATYRYGSSGPGDPSLGGPAIGTLVTVVTPVPGLGSVRNPVAMTGGAAPGTPTQVQQNAASSTAAFSRAVAPSDYQAIAMQASSVTLARAHVGWNPQAQRSTITLFVAGGADAVTDAQALLATAVDPNRPVIVGPATEVDLLLAFTVTYDPTVGASAVQSGVIAALTDPTTGLFAPAQTQIGSPLYDSSIYSACKKVSGVLAVRNLAISNITGLAATDLASAPVLTGVVHSPGPGGYFAVAPGAVNVTLEAGNG
jgi:hypothetical protein